MPNSIFKKQLSPIKPGDPIDYKDVELLKKFITEKKINSSIIYLCKSIFKMLLIISPDIGPGDFCFTNGILTP